MDYLIRRRATGSTDAFANRLGICRRSLFNYLKHLRALGAEIEFSKESNSYIYTKPGKLWLECRFDAPEKVKGGINLQSANLLHSQRIYLNRQVTFWPKTINSTLPDGGIPEKPYE